jgi:flagellar L-ring protein precursor FlgH
MKPLLIWLLIAAAAGSSFAAGALKRKPPEPSPLDRYIEEAREAKQRTPGATPGSIWMGDSPYSDLARDLRAAQVDDLVTIVVAERATASATGNTKTSRKSDATSAVPAIFGPASSKWKELASVSSDTQLQGQGTTSRETVMTTTLAARVTAVLPNRYLVVEGTKDSMVNSERQVISVRGILRPADLSPANVVRSDRLANLEIRINGKGVVGDAVRRPNFLYRLLLGLLPF